MVFLLKMYKNKEFRLRNSRAERGRLCDIFATRECASSRSVFYDIGRNFLYHKKGLQNVNITFHNPKTLAAIFFRLFCEICCIHNFHLLHKTSAFLLIAALYPISVIISETFSLIRYHKTFIKSIFFNI